MTLPRIAPYLPFLAGPPEFTVGLRPIPPGAWLLPDIEAASLEGKRRLLRERRDDVLRALGRGEAASMEAARLISSETGLALPPAEHPLAAAAELVSDDLVVMAPSGEGEWRSVALVLCSPTFFSAEDAIGRTLGELHHPVPDRLGSEGTQGLAARIGRVFAHLQTQTVLERFNWTLQAGDERYTPSSAPLRARARAAPVEAASALLHLRVERQTIRKLPETGAVLFTIRVVIDRLAPILADARARSAFEAAWRGAGAHVSGYKRWGDLAHLVEALLR